MYALYQVSIRQATISLSFLLAHTSRCKPWESLWGSLATTPLGDFHHRLTACPSYQKTGLLSAPMGIGGLILPDSSCHANRNFSHCPCTLQQKFPETPLPTIMPFTLAIIVIIVPPDIINLH